MYIISLSLAKQIYLSILHYHRTAIEQTHSDSLSKQAVVCIYLYLIYLIMSVTFESWDLVSNPLFWKGIVIESFGDKVVVNRNNKLFWLRTVNRNIFEADMEARVTKKKKTGKDYDEQYFDMHREDDLLTNDQI